MQRCCCGKKYAIAFRNKNKWIKTITRCAKSDTLAALTTSEQKEAPRHRTKALQPAESAAVSPRISGEKARCRKGCFPY
jgi:hypothetical protein